MVDGLRLREDGMDDREGGITTTTSSVLGGIKHCCPIEEVRNLKNVPHEPQGEHYASPATCPRAATVSSRLRCA